MMLMVLFLEHDIHDVVDNERIITVRILFLDDNVHARENDVNEVKKMKK